MHFHPWDETLCYLRVSVSTVKGEKVKKLRTSLRSFKEGNVARQCSQFIAVGDGVAG